MEIDKICIIADGPTETGSLEKMFHKHYYKCPLLRYGPGNGDSYSEMLFAKRIAPLIVFVLTKDAHSVIIIPDLENRARKRKTTIEMFSSKIKKAIIEEIVKTSSFKQDYLEDVIYVCPSDIMFENWIISDIEGVKRSKIINENAKQDYYDGKNGAHILDDIMKYKYKKTRDAQNLFKYVNKDIGISNSPSFRCFIEVLEEQLKK